MPSTPEATNCGGKGCVFPLPFGTGGGSSVNGMMYVRGCSGDFDRWCALVDDPRWCYTNALNYFKRSEKNFEIISRYHSALGPMSVSWPPHNYGTAKAFEGAFAAKGYSRVDDINGPGQIGYSRIQTTTGCGKRSSTYRAFVEPALKSNRPGLTVLTYADVQKDRTAYAAKEVIITAGALHSPQILMCSGIGPCSDIEAANLRCWVDRPGVGQNLQDHPRPTAMEFKCPLCDVDWNTRKRDLNEYDLLHLGALTEAAILQLTAFVNTGIEGAGLPEKCPDLQIILLGATESKDGERCMDNDVWRHNIVKWLPAVLHPESRGEVTLDPSDPFGRPVVTLGYFTSQNDVKVAIRGLEMGVAMADELAKRGLILDRTPIPPCRDFEFATREYWECAINATSYTLWHFSGTCSMGKITNPLAVVDSSLRVIGVDGLSVCDASVMPFVTSGNTNAPTCMIAEQCADLVRARHGLPEYRESPFPEPPFQDPPFSEPPFG
ncbi:glucose dehydrogenase [FAD, quinone]-like isoform X2 [Thrips palmi]|uniref:Glucose dehydrogenase [FAD, quinone]-like isoform X2 n=1 Tax=Thrips palmi TaxID=161013 RepID=A0A6P8Y7J1_THRPL|nr:glucose dehydrogenase [FAD, quinone]-like isoform X2 [Thrips palmi]